MNQGLSGRRAARKAEAVLIKPREKGKRSTKSSAEAARAGRCGHRRPATALEAPGAGALNVHDPKNRNVKVRVFRMRDDLGSLRPVGPAVHEDAEEEQHARDRRREHRPRPARVPGAVGVERQPHPRPLEVVRDLARTGSSKATPCLRGAWHETQHTKYDLGAL